MTIEINLLPWREAQRQRRSQRFFAALVLSALAGLGIGCAATWHYEQRILAQQERHRLIEARLAELDGEIRAVSRYEAQVATLERRIVLLQRLQAARPQTVHVFNALAATLEEGVHYASVAREDDLLRLTGLAEDNRRVADQLRALEASPVLDVPVLSEVASVDGRRRFDLSVGQRMPGLAGKEGAP